MFNREKKLTFSIRKFSVGVASALIGIGWVFSNQPVIAEQQHTTKAIRYQYVLESELKADEKAKIVAQLPSHQVNQMDTYYMVYRPTNQLPNTGNQTDTWLAVAGSGILLIGVAISKGRKRKYIATLIFLASSGQAVHVSAIEAYQLADYNQTYQLEVGAALPDGVVAIPNHQFIGYIVEDNIPDGLAIKPNVTAEVVDKQTAGANPTSENKPATETKVDEAVTVPTTPADSGDTPGTIIPNPSGPDQPATPSEQVRYETELEEVVFTEQTISDNSLPVGTTQLITTGQNGLIEHTVKITEKADGSVTREIIATKQLSPVVHQVTAIGTKPVAPHQPVITSADVAIPFSVEYVEDDTRPIGEDVITQYGQDGLKRITYTDGVVTAEVTITEPVKQIILRGSKVADQPITTETTESIPFETEIIEDATLTSGTEIIVQNGQNGTRTNKLVNGTIVSSTITTEPVKEIIRRGTYVAPIDKTVLQNQVDAAIAQTEANFTPASYAVLSDAREKALAVLADPSATQDQINEQVAQLTEALAQLVAKEPNVLTFKEERVPYETQTVNDPDLPAGTQKVVQDGHDGLIGITYTNGVESKRTVIRESQPKIVHIGTKVVANKQALINTINSTHDLEEFMFSPASWEKYVEALQAAQAILNKEDASQTEVDQARATLQAAKERLTVDKTQLAADILAANRLDQADYDTTSWQTFNAKLEQARQVLNNNATKQSEINQAVTELDQARRALGVNRQDLDVQIQAAQQIDRTRYTNQTLANMDQALQNAQQVASTQSAIDRATTQLENAIAQLAPLKDKPVLAWQDLTKNDFARSATISFQLTDPQQAHHQTVVQLYQGEQLVKTVTIADFSATVFEDLAYDTPYRIVTSMTYDVGNGLETEIIEERTFMLELKQIEIKDIDQLDLYSFENGQAIIHKSLVAAPQQTANYFVRVSSDRFRDMLLPVSNIEAVTLEDGKAGYKVTTNLPELVQDQDLSAKSSYKKQLSFMLEQTPTAQTDVYTDFATLVQAIEANKSGTFILGANLYAGNYTTPKNGEAYISGAFTGRLIGEHDGKKYAIYDLKAPLFNQLNNSTVEKLDLKRINIIASGSDVGALARYADAGTISDVSAQGHVQAVRHVGGLVARNRGIIRNASFTGTVASTSTGTTDSSHTGGIAGMNWGGLVEKVYVNATVTTAGTNDNHRTGAIIGEMNNGAAVVKNSYATGRVINLGTSVNVGGLVGTLRHWNGVHGNLNNVISAVEVTNGAMIQAHVPIEARRMVNVFAVRDQVSGLQQDHVTFLSAEEAHAKLAEFDITTTLSDSKNLADTHILVTDYLSLANAQANRSTAYNNTEKLLPFYDKETIVKYGNKIDSAHPFFTKEIISITPMKHGKVVSDVYSHKVTLDQLMIYYADRTVGYVPIQYKEDFRQTGISEYTIVGTPLIYTPEQFLASYDRIVTEVLPELEQVSYKSKATTDAINVGNTITQVEIDKLVKAGQTVEDAKNTLIQQRMDQLYLEPSFNDVKANLAQLLRNILATDKSINTTAGVVEDYLIDYIRDHKEKLLLGLAYVQRWYNIRFGETNIQDLVTFHQDFYGKPVNTMEWLVSLADAGYANIQLKNNLATYADHMAQHSGFDNLFAYLSANRKLFTDFASDNDWFKATSKAYMVETPSQERPDRDVTLWNRLTSVPDEKVNVLPLLSAQEGIFIISNMTGITYGMYDRYMSMALKDTNPVLYQQKIEEMKKRVNQAAEWQRAHFDVWYRIVPDEVKERLFRDVPTWDGYRVNGKWLPMYGEGANQAILDFFGPIERGRIANNGSGAYANGVATFYVHDRVLDEYGSSVYTHEMVHNNDTHSYLGGYARREGQGAELYAKGFLQSPDAGYRTNYLTLNLMFDYSDHKDDETRLVNATPDRFQTADDLQEYMSGVFDVLYTLDYAEAQSVLARDNTVKGQWFQKVKNYYVQDPKTGMNTHAGNRLDTLSTVELDRLTDWQSLVRENIMVSREYGRQQHFKRNGYFVAALFSPIYGALPNETGSPGDLIFRRMAFELLAAKGYRDGFIPYTSNQLAQEAYDAGERTYSNWLKRDIGLVTDTRVFNAVFGNEYTDWTDFKINMFQQRINKRDQWKEFTINYNNQQITIQSFDQIQTLMDQAVENDVRNNTITNSGRSNVRKLKVAIYNAMLRLTDDFSESIYK